MNYKELIFSNLKEEDIFEFYTKNKVELGRAYNSFIRKDFKPSTGYYISKTGKLIYSDFVDGSRYDCINFVMKLFDIEYFEAIKKIVEDFQITELGAIVPEEVAPRIKEDVIINIVPRPFTKKDLIYWNGYWISERELERWRIYSVEQTLIRGRRINTKEDELKYAYVISDEEKEYVKLYSPYSTDYKWVSNIPLSLPYGLNDVGSGKTLIISKSLKDMIVLRKLTSNVIGLQNESLAALRDEDFVRLKDKFERIVVFFDNDEAGRRASMAMCEKFGIEEIFIPERALKLGVKDPSDYIKKFGLKELNKIYRWLISTN